MASVNPLSREIVFKLVYYGPGLSGKTTTLQHIHATAKPEHRGKMVSLATPVDRTLYFDFLPIRLPRMRGMSVRLQLFTVPGQVYYNATRKLVLTGVDGLVFVADAQASRLDANLESLENLRDNLAENGTELEELPLVLQYNKCDLPDLVPVADLDAQLNPTGAPSLLTSATQGVGIYEALDLITRAVLRRFEQRLPESGGQPIGARFEPVEGGLATALRLAAPSDRPVEAVVARIPPPATPSGQFSHVDLLSTSTPPPSSAAEPGPQPAAPVREAPAPAVAVSPQAPPVGLSFAALWPEEERATVHDAERALAEGRYARAVELADVLVARVLASAAGLFGSTEAPRDAALVPMLLGLDGRRYLAFRAIVRGARGGDVIEAQAALEAYAFSVEARVARSSVG